MSSSQIPQNIKNSQLDTREKITRNVKTRLRKWKVNFRYVQDCISLAIFLIKFLSILLLSIIIAAIIFHKKSECENPSEFLYIANISYTNQSENGMEFNCFAVLINPQTLLTSGHCALLDDTNSIKELRIFEFKMNEELGKTMENEKFIIDRDEIMNIIKYPDYDPIEKLNDIALIILKNPLNLKQSLLLLESAFDKNILSDESVELFDIHNRTFKKHDLELLNSAECYDLLNMEFAYDQGRFCSAYESPFYQQNSGLPIFINKNMSFPVGILSFGNKTNDSQTLAFTRISFFLEWIICNSPRWDDDIIAIAGCGKCKETLKYENVDLQANPWTAMIYNLDKILNCKSYGCAAFVINERTFVTAAHCVSGDIKSIVISDIRFCEQSTCTKDELTIIKIDQDDIIVHPNFSPNSRANDIALIILKMPLKFNEFFYPINLPLEDSDLPNNLTFVKWSKGYTLELEEEMISVLSPEICSEKMNMIFDLFSDRFCAGDELYIDKGNSGLPIYLKGENGATAYGATSFGSSNGVSPIVYSDLAYHKDWIVFNSPNETMQL